MTEGLRWGWSGRTWPREQQRADRHFWPLSAASKAMRGAAGRPLPVLPFQLDAANRRS